MKEMKTIIMNSLISKVTEMSPLTNVFNIENIFWMLNWIINIKIGWTMIKI